MSAILSEVMKMMKTKNWTAFRSLAAGVLGLTLLACAPAAAPAATSKPAAPAAKPTSAPAAAPAATDKPAAPAAAEKPAQPAAKLADFPSKPIEIIVPYPPGGGFDAVSRALANPLGKELGQPVVVKNVPGGNQRIGARQFEQAPPDGHTLFFVGDTGVYVSTFIEPAEGFDMLSWVWVAGIRQLNPYVGVGKDSPFKTIQDVMAAEKAGQRIRMGHNGIGGFLPNNAVFAEAIGLKNVVHVGGFGGTGDLVPSMVRGDLDLHIYQPISSTVQFVQSGDIRALMVLKPQRDQLLPDVPTAREAGAPNIDDLEGIGGQTIGFNVVKNTPPERVRVLEQATLNALKDPEFMAWAKQSGVDQDLLSLPGAAMKAGKEKEYGIFAKNADVLRRVVNQ